MLATQSVSVVQTAAMVTGMAWPAAHQVRFMQFEAVMPRLSRAAWQWPGGSVLKGGILSQTGGNIPRMWLAISPRA